MVALMDRASRRRPGLTAMGNEGRMDRHVSRSSTASTHPEPRRRHVLHSALAVPRRRRRRRQTSSSSCSKRHVAMTGGRIRRVRWRAERSTGMARRGCRAVKRDGTDDLESYSHPIRARPRRVDVWVARGDRGPGKARILTGVNVYGPRQRGGREASRPRAASSPPTLGADHERVARARRLRPTGNAVGTAGDDGSGADSYQPEEMQFT